MIREVGTTIGRAVLDGIGRAASRLQERRALSADFLESDDAYLAVFDAPGASAADVSVRFEDDTLSVSIDRFREFHEDYEMVFPGRGLALDGEVELPAGVAVEADRADATLTQNGTLEVLIPKVETGAGEGETASSLDTDASNN
jgi:HSP20 family molecular chaperone IbpA